MMCATAVVLLTGCGVTGGSGAITIQGTAGPAGVAGASSSPASAQPAGKTGPSTTSPPASEKPTGSKTKKGCPAGGPGLPPEAQVAQAGDLDGDGKSDTLWIGFDQKGTQVFGVQTASGARFSTTYSTVNDPQRGTSSLWADRLGDGTAVMLLDTTNEVRLYAVIDCAIVVTRNKQNNQYVFDRGNLGNGTGVGCPVIGSTGRHLVGYLAEDTASGYSVSRTAITFSERGRRALNGPTTVLGQALSKTNPTVLRARNVSCGVSHQALEQAS